jgi:hypothetical protein
MTREGKPERYLREGIQPFLKSGETHSSHKIDSYVDFLTCYD